MKLTPLEIKQFSFRSTWRGYEKGDVEAFRDTVREAFEQVARENQELRDEVRRLNEQVGELKGREDLLRETLVTARKVSEDLTEGARREASGVVAQAELQADKLVMQAQRRVEKILSDIADLKRDRASAMTGLKALLEGHLSLLEAFQEGGTEDQIEGTLSFLPGMRAAGKGQATEGEEEETHEELKTTGTKAGGE